MTVPASFTNSLDELFEPFSTSEGPGLVVGVSLAGKAIYRRGFGLASIESGIENGPSTRMRIGSTTKHFACLAVLLLAEQGRLDIDAPIGSYLYGLRSPGCDSTLRQLMTHTSGWRCHVDLSLLTDGLAVKPVGAAMNVLAAQRNLNFPPGTSMLYSNGGYHLISQVIQQVSGQTLRSLLVDRVFRPLEMSDTTLLISDMCLHPGMATLHVPQSEGLYRRGIFFSEEVLAEGGIVSTVDDMLRWLAHLRLPKLIGSPSVWRQMLTRTVLGNGRAIDYCLGLIRSLHGDKEIIHHAGGVLGGTCQMLTVPREELDIVIMSNGVPVKPTELARKIVDCVLSQGRAPATKKNAKPDAVKGLAGSRYLSLKSGSIVRLVEDQGDLKLVMMEADSMPLALRWIDKCLEARADDSAMVPIRLKAGDHGWDSGPPTLLEVEIAGYSEVYERMSEALLDGQTLATELVGQYDVPEAAATAVVRLANDALVLNMKGRYGHTDSELTPLSRDQLRFQMIDPPMPISGVLHVLRSEEGVVGLKLNTVRTRGLLLERKRCEVQEAA